jgi:hypothetical protein
MKRLLSWFERKKYADEVGEIDLPKVLTSNFSPANELEKLLIDAGYDPESRPAFEQCFLEHHLLIAIRDDGHPGGPLNSSEAGGLGIFTLTADDGENYPAGFTAEERGYDCFGPETVMAKLPGKDLLQMISEAGIWINPSSPFGVLWTSKDVKRILQGN